MGSNPPEKWSSPADNMCEICGNQATVGMLDDPKYVYTRIRYSCHKHYQELYDKLVQEQKKGSRI